MSVSQKRVILLDNPFKMVKRTVGRELLEWLASRVEVAAHNLEKPLDLEKLPPADFIIALGGDGTILATVRALGNRQIPLIGVNMGKLGFLAEFSLRHLQEQFDRILADDSLRSVRSMLQCELQREGKTIYHTMAVNELAVIAGPPFRMIEVSVSVRGEHLALCAGDGIIIATPTGSTAYNLSAGGPILEASLPAAVITPLAAHSLSFRPIVVDIHQPIVLQFQESSYNGPEPEGLSRRAMISIDGQDNVALEPQDFVTVTKASAVFTLIRNPKQGQWRVLNTKLNWGALPNYEKNSESSEGR